MKATGAVLAGSVLSGVLSSVCCVAPLVLVFFGVSGGALAHLFEPMRPYLLAATYGLLAGAYYLTYRPRPAECGVGQQCDPSRTKLLEVGLWIATLVVVSITAFPLYSQLGRTQGVTAYEVSLENAEAEVTYEPARTTPEQIAASVSKTGFSAGVKASGGKGGGTAGPGADAGAKGDGMGGSCQRDCGKSARSPAAAAPEKDAAGLVSLAEDLSPLAADFNAAKARPRFLAILSPTCSACVHGAEAVKAAVLPEGEAFEVFVVWAPMLDSDGAQAASRSSAILRRPGVRQYWDPRRRVGTAFRNDVFPDAVERMKRSLPQDHVLMPYFVARDRSQPEWDIYLFFEPGVDWAARAPAPSRWVRQTMLFPGKGKEEPSSVLWTNDYASAPVEGSLTEQLRRLASPARAAR